MASLYTQQDSNIAKTWILMVVFFMIVISTGYFFSFYYQSPSILYFAFFFSLIMNIGSYWFSDKITLAVSRARIVKKAEYPDYYNTVENLSITAGLPMPKIYVIDDPAPNALATGRNKEHAAVAATTGLLNMMEKTELEGVIAHELSHIGNKDILLSTVVVVLVGLITLMSDFFIRMSFFGGGNRNREGNAGAILGLIGIVLAILTPIIATLIQLAISRRRESLADTDGALLTRYPEGLALALEKIAGYQKPMLHANNATAHLYISNPFGPDNKKVSAMARLFMTHPPIQERIKALRESEVK